MDFYSDTGNTLLKAICEVRPAPDFVKQASVIDKDSIPAEFFALPEKKAFSIADPASTYISFGYWLFNKNAMDESERQRAKESLVKAAEFYGITDEILDLAKKYQGAKETIQEKKAESNYGIPERKEFPLHTDAHVHEAMEVFPLVHQKYPMDERVKIAQQIVKKASMFDMPVRTQIVIKYASAPQEFCREDQAAANIAARALFVQDLEGQQLFNKLAHGMMGNMGGPSMMLKMAGMLERLDEHFGVPAHNVLPPMQTMFNMGEKQALEMQASRPININGESYSLGELAKIPADYYGEVFGSDFEEAIKAENGMVDPEKLEQIIHTLPLPEKNILNRYLKQFFASQG